MKRRLRKGRQHDQANRKKVPGPTHDLGGPDLPASGAVVAPGDDHQQQVQAPDGQSTQEHLVGGVQQLALGQHHCNNKQCGSVWVVW